MSILLSPNSTFHLPSPSASLFERSMQALASSFKIANGSDDYGACNHHNTPEISTHLAHSPKSNETLETFFSSDRKECASLSDASSTNKTNNSYNNNKNNRSSLLSPGVYLPSLNCLNSPTTETLYQAYTSLTTSNNNNSESSKCIWDKDPISKSSHHMESNITLPSAFLKETCKKIPVHEYIVGSFLDSMETLTPTTDLTFDFDLKKSSSSNSKSSSEKYVNQLNYHNDMLLLDLEDMASSFAAKNSDKNDMIAAAAAMTGVGIHPNSNQNYENLPLVMDSSFPSSSYSQNNNDFSSIHLAPAAEPHYSSFQTPSEEILHQQHTSPSFYPAMPIHSEPEVNMQSESLSLPLSLSLPETQTQMSIPMQTQTEASIIDSVIPISNHPHPLHHRLVHELRKDLTLIPTIIVQPPVHSSQVSPEFSTVTSVNGLSSELDTYSTQHPITSTTSPFANQLNQNEPLSNSFPKKTGVLHFHRTTVLPPLPGSLEISTATHKTSIRANLSCTFPGCTKRINKMSRGYCPSHAPNKNKPFRCDICPQTFSRSHGNNFSISISIMNLFIFFIFIFIIIFYFCGKNKRDNC